MTHKGYVKYVQASMGILLLLETRGIGLIMCHRGLEYKICFREVSFTSNDNNMNLDAQKKIGTLIDEPLLYFWV